ncbi:MAG: hypothetical protein NUV74_19310, partial [Candidatus Brocadiaceae bacterium]|nr:hypothetical protein [Candidatus Brocadiaceae bacterium]
PGGKGYLTIPEEHIFCLIATMIRSSWSSTSTFLKSLEGSLLKGSFRSCAGVISLNRDGQRCILHINGLPLLRGLEEVELSGVALVVEVNRIVTAEAGVTKSLHPAVEKAVHTLKGK